MKRCHSLAVGLFFVVISTALAQPHADEPWPVLGLPTQYLDVSGNSVLGAEDTYALPRASANGLTPLSLISRDDVITRARAWVGRVTYSMAEPYEDGWRRDCSGYVSYCWNAGRPGYGTGTMYQITHPISKDELMAGDAMLMVASESGSQYGHTLIFESWADEGRTSYWAYEMHGPTGAACEHRVVPYPYWWVDCDPNYYHPVRYDYIQDGVTGHTAQAVIDSITPQHPHDGQVIQFRGHGTCSQGHAITEYEWWSQQAGYVGNGSGVDRTLPVGSHTISFRVKCSGGEWGERVYWQQNPLVVEPHTVGAVIESVSPTNVCEGETVRLRGHGWCNIHDPNYIAYQWYSTRDGTIGRAGYVDVNTLSAGEHTIKFRVQCAGGKWSAYKEFGQKVVVRHAAQAVIDSITPQHPYDGQTIQFRGHATCSQGHAITDYEWWSQQAGYVGNWSSVDRTLPVGSHTISFRVKCSGGEWSPRIYWEHNPLVVEPHTVGAIIDSVTPTTLYEGQTLRLRGHGWCNIHDPNYIDYQWRSDLDGTLGRAGWVDSDGLSVGEHTIKFRVQCAGGRWSAFSEFPQKVVVLPFTGTILPDAYEPDDRSATASTISAGETQDHNIHLADDIDWAKFTLATPSQVTITATDDTEMWLYRSSGAMAEYSPGNGSLAQIGPMPLAAGTYFIKVQEKNNNATIEAYTLSLDAVSLANPDRYEPDDTSGTAKEISPRETQNRSIHAVGNVDWAKFRLTAPAEVTIAATGDTEMWLYRSSGALVTHQAGTGDGAQFGPATLTPGAYLVRVQGRGSTIIEAYTLSLHASTSITADGYEPDDSSGTAKTIAPGETQNRSIHAVGNMDWARFSLIASAQVTISTTGDTQMWLYRSSGALVTHQAGTGDGAQFGPAALGAGAYLIRVQALGANATIETYTLSLDAVPLVVPDSYEADDSSRTAKEILSGQTQNRSIHAVGNMDWAKFYLASPAQVTITATGDTEMWLYRSSGSVAQYSPGNGSLAEIGPMSLPAGMYLIRVQEKGNNATIEAYSLSLVTSP